MKRLRRYLPKKWQDAVFAVGEIVFMVSLLPSVINHNTPAASTSLATSFMLCCFLTVHYSYKLWFTMALTLVTIGLWFTMFLQAV